MKTFFKRGLIAVAPLALTLGILYWLFSFLEELLGPPLKAILGEYYYPGMGVLVAVILLFFIGILLNTWLISKITHAFDHLFKKIPIFNSLYKMVKNVTQFFQASPDQGGKQVVEVTIGGKSMIGFVTRNNFSDIPKMPSDKVAVFFPMSYQIGGYTLFVKPSDIKPLDLTIEETLQHTIIAWTKTNP